MLIPKQVGMQRSCVFTGARGMKKESEGVSLELEISHSRVLASDLVQSPITSSKLCICCAFCLVPFRDHIAGG